MIFLRPTNGAKLLMNKWIEEVGSLFWAKLKEGNDQPAFNWALNKTAHEVCIVASSKFHNNLFYFRFHLAKY